MSEEEWIKAAKAEVEESFNYDNNDDFDKYKPSDWIKYYEKVKARGKDDYAVSRYLDNIFHLRVEFVKIAEKNNIKIFVLEKFIATNYVDDKYGGLAMKKQLEEGIKELKNRVMMKRFDESWQGKNYPTLGNALVGYAYKTQPFMRFGE